MPFIYSRFSMRYPSTTTLLKWYIWMLLLFGFAYQIAHPIIMGDTDMWYHLNGGRYFWNHFRVPSSPFFSFILPERDWINYFWGFQAISFKLFDLSGYYGLITFRAILFLSITFIVFKFLFADKWNECNLIPLITLLILYFIFFEARCYQVRPHLFSYFFIPYFLYVLEFRPRLCWTLPFCTIIWVNMHGIEYVVGALICGAYVIEYIIESRTKKQRNNERDWKYITWVLLCGFALFLTPNGMAILYAPFVFPSKISMYISEMAPPPIEDFYTFIINGLHIPSDTAFAFLFLLFVFSAARLTLDRRLRISHVIIAAGGIILLSKGFRFRSEWALLSLPVLSAGIRHINVSLPGNKIFSASSILLIFILLSPFSSIAPSLYTYNGYPFDTSGLPVGITRFLRQANTGGNFLTPPTTAGFMQWKLNNYKIYSDMEFPPFTDFEFYKIQSAFNSATALKKINKEYNISYISIDKNNVFFREIVKQTPEFKPVFFDDTQILYANILFVPEVVSKYELKFIDPYSPMDSSKEANEKVLELLKIKNIFPNGSEVNHALGNILFNEKRFYEAMPIAIDYFKYFPMDPNSSFLIGNILENTGRCNEAIDYFNISMTYAGNSLKKELHIHIGSCYYLIKDFVSSYNHLWKGLNPFLHKEELENLFQLAFSAASIGKANEAIMLLKMILFQCKDDDNYIRKKSTALLNDLRNADLNSSSLLDSFL